MDQPVIASQAEPVDNFRMAVGDAAMLQWQAALSR